MFVNLNYLSTFYMSGMILSNAMFANFRINSSFLDDKAVKGTDEYWDEEDEDPDMVVVGGVCWWIIVTGWGGAIGIVCLSIIGATTMVCVVLLVVDVVAILLTLITLTLFIKTSKIN